MDDKKLRYAVVGASAEKVRPYMPANYDAHPLPGDERDAAVLSFLIGADVAVWTLDDYVIPRLASGLYFGREVSREELEELGVTLTFEGDEYRNAWSAAHEDDVTRRHGEPPLDEGSR